MMAFEKDILIEFHPDWAVVQKISEDWYKWEKFSFLCTPETIENMELKLVHDVIDHN